MSGVQASTSLPSVISELRKSADVIAVDQRGTGDQNDPPAIRCARPDPQGSGGILPLDQALSPESALRIHRAAAEDCARRWRGRGLDLSAYNTEESAADLEDLRRHLAAEKINLWAISYGTHVALAYIRRYPGRVNRVVLHGVEGPDHTYKLPSNIQTSLEHLDRLAEDDPRIRKTVPDFLNLVRGVLESLARRPATETVRDPADGSLRRVVVGKSDLQLWTALQLATRDGTRSCPPPTAPSRAATSPISPAGRSGTGGRRRSTSSPC